MKRSSFNPACCVRAFGLVLLLILLPANAPWSAVVRAGQPPSWKSDGPGPAVDSRLRAASELFRQHCLKCHGADGTGAAVRHELPKIPDFTDARWQQSRSNVQLLVSILNGNEPTMPAFRDKNTEAQARDLTAHVRSFASSASKPGQEKNGVLAAPRDFEEEFRGLQQEMDELRRQFRELSQGSTDRGPSRAREPAPGAAPPRPSDSQPSFAPRPPAPAAGGAPATGDLFKQHCVKCHGEDGTGAAVRDKLPKIPDFTDARWQQGRSDAQFLVSILDGNEPTMPGFRDKLTEAKARELVAQVRKFGVGQNQRKPAPQNRQNDDPEGVGQPAKPMPGHRVSQARREELAPARRQEQLELEERLLPKLVRWLGKFHPSAVHFPIALLTAAAVAELLQMATGKPTFAGVSRYCVWFASLTGLVAALFGWFAGGFQVSDPSWILTMHRWLGTCTLGCSVVALVLSETSCRISALRRWFRVTLFAAALGVFVTGFLGGTLVFGVHHYAWPP